MPKYVIPQETGPEVEEASVNMGMGPPNLYIPANSAIMEALALDSTVKVTLHGTVKGMDSREIAGETPQKEFRLEVKSVEAYPVGEFEDLALDDDETEGY